VQKKSSGFKGRLIQKVKDFKCKTCHRRTEGGDYEEKENVVRGLEGGME
jgi:hypothetical protein